MSEVMLSVIIPVFNERNNIEILLSKVDAVPIKKEIIVVDDGSCDGTPEYISQVSKRKFPDLRLFCHDRNQGKGAAIRTGLSKVKGDIIIIQDADLEYDPKEYIKLIQPIKDGKTEVVYGSRYLNIHFYDFIKKWLRKKIIKDGAEVSYLHHFLGIKILNLLTNLLYNASITDEATCYKVFKTSVLQGITLKCTGFEFCPEITAKIRKKGYHILEIPISYHPRTKEEGKKLKWTHGFNAIWTLIKYRFTN